MSINELEHHGVRGMKWGVRRKRHLKEMANKAAKAEKRGYYRDAEYMRKRAAGGRTFAKNALVGALGGMALNVAYNRGNYESGKRCAVVLLRSAIAGAAVSTLGTIRTNIKAENIAENYK